MKKNIDNKRLRQKAYAKYRKNPQCFFEEKIHSVSKDERALINPSWPWFWSKYHYNLVENGIMEILVENDINLEDGITVLDIGVGTGHWIDFYTAYFNVSEIWGVDFCETPLNNLKNCYPRLNVHFLQWDISTALPDELMGKQFKIITAIGVMFHIVDDDKWKRAVGNLMRLMHKDSIIIIGGDFGKKTIERGIMRKNRSFKVWESLCNKNHAEICSLKRFDWWAGADNDGITDNLIAIRVKNKH